jgi:hypothetical protein
MNKNILSLSTYTNQVSTSIAIAAIILIIVMFTPLANYGKTCVLLKLISILIIIYAIYMIKTQINIMNNSIDKNNDTINTHLQTNLACNYVVIGACIILIIIILKSFFTA